MAVLSSVWALWLMQDRPTLAVALGIVCAAVLVVGLSKRHPAPAGLMQVDDLGRVFWRSIPVDRARGGDPSAEQGGRGDLMVPSKWHRAERSVWIRLEADGSSVFPENKAMLLDLRIAASGASAEDWAALQRWLVWLERGKLR